VTNIVDVSFPNGNVGIGTDAPGADLDVVGQVRADYLSLNSQDSVNEGGELHLEGAGSNNGWIIDTFASEFRVFNDEDPSKFLQISASGNIGVGGVSPGADALTVNGTVKAAGIALTTGAADGHVLTSNTLGTASWQEPNSAPQMAVFDVAGSGFTFDIPTGVTRIMVEMWGGGGGGGGGAGGGANAGGGGGGGAYVKAVIGVVDSPNVTITVGGGGAAGGDPGTAGGET
jgi:hypothetical protein